MMTLLAQDMPSWEALWNLSPALALVVFIAIVVRMVARWLKPWIEKVFQVHIDFVNSLDEQTKKNTATLSEMSDVLKRQNGTK